MNNAHMGVNSIFVGAFESALVTKEVLDFVVHNLYMLNDDRFLPTVIRTLRAVEPAVSKHWIVNVCVKCQDLFVASNKVALLTLARLLTLVLF